jgi:hypothetical protein
MGRGEKLIDFLDGEDLAIETHFDTKIQQRVHAENEGRCRSNGRLDGRAARPVHVPIGRHADDEAGPLHRFYILEEAHRVLRRPTQGMKEFAGVDDVFQPGAGLARLLNGGQEPQ